MGDGEGGHLLGRLHDQHVQVERCEIEVHLAGRDFLEVKDVIDNVTVPAGAVLTVIDEDGLYVPLKRMNFGGEYVDATADFNVYFEVVAQNTVTTILYQLQPEVPDGEVFVTSKEPTTF